MVALPHTAIDEIDFKNPNYSPIMAERSERLLHIRRMSAGYLNRIKVYYITHPTDFINDWFFTYDPRNATAGQPVMVPFLLFPKQKEYILWLDERCRSKTDGVVEKSRDVGCTWLNMAWAIHRWLFTEVKIGFGSRKEQLVDRIGDPDSIFEKGRMILRYLPAEFLPRGMKEDVNLCHMKFLNPETGSSITGEAGDNIGRGGRNTIYFKDESAFYEHPLLIDSALSQNSDVKIDVSTPNGNGNLFFQKRHGGKYPVFVFDWKDDPRKDQAWYEKQQETLDPIILAQEVDRDYSASVEGICIPSKWVRTAVELNLGDDSGVYVAGLDVADEGRDKNALAIRKGSTLRFIHHWGEGNTTQTARKAALICREWQCQHMRFDKIGVGAGVKGELSQESFNDIRAIGLSSGSSPSPGFFTEGKKNEDMFRNAKAQWWWLLRRRFQMTYEHVKGLKAHDPDEMISIPNDPDLISELSQPKYFLTENGKIQIEAKRDMKRRGLKSPNKADAMALCFAPFRKASYGSFGRGAPRSSESGNLNYSRGGVGDLPRKAGSWGRSGGKVASVHMGS